MRKVDIIANLAILNPCEKEIDVNLVEHELDARHEGLADDDQLLDALGRSQNIRQYVKKVAVALNVSRYDTQSIDIGRRCVHTELIGAEREDGAAPLLVNTLVLAKDATALLNPFPNNVG